MPHRFPPEVERELKTYVYRLIDPRNGATFYVGTGEGNRVFAHVRDELGSPGDPEGDKLRVIREICNAGLERLVISFTATGWITLRLLRSRRR